jgi:5'-nucleotidase/UDP-sugar diphosphatase
LPTPCAHATGADVAIMNGGGIRADRTYDAGAKLTRRDILTELPFGNVTVVTELPGSQLLLGARKRREPGREGGRALPAGVGPDLCLGPVGGSRASGCPKSWSAARRLIVDKLYKVAVNDYILGGGDGYAALGGGKIITGTGGGNLVATDVMTYVEKAGKVAPTVEGRIKILGQ